MLNEFQDRGWIERNTNGEYVSTPLGHSIAVAFNPLVESMAAIQHFGEGPGTMWRAPNELSIDVGRRDGWGGGGTGRGASGWKDGPSGGTVIGVRR